MILTWKPPGWFFPRQRFFPVHLWTAFLFFLSVTHFIIHSFVSNTFFKNQPNRRFTTKKKFFYFLFNYPGIISYVVNPKVE